MDKINKREFLREFKELLQKYNATIEFSVSECSDTHGLSGEKMVVYHTIPNSYKTEELIAVSGWGIDTHDIKLSRR